jgi:hypothetical protein
LKKLSQLGLEDFDVHDQAVAILHQQIPRVTDSLPSPFFAKSASGSVFDACVSFDRRSPRKLTVGLPGSSDGGCFLSFA